MIQDQCKKSISFSQFYGVWIRIRITNADLETEEPKQLRIQIQNTGYVDIDERYRKRDEFDPREDDI